MYLFRLQIGGLLIKIMLILKFASTFSETWAPGRQWPFSSHKPAKSASPRPDLLEFAAGSDVSAGKCSRQGRRQRMLNAGAEGVLDQWQGEPGN